MQGPGDRRQHAQAAWQWAGPPRLAEVPGGERGAGVRFQSLVRAQPGAPGFIRSTIGGQEGVEARKKFATLRITFIPLF